MIVTVAHNVLQSVTVEEEKKEKMSKCGECFS